ncbi:MAG: YciC family protein [Candidatus Neomarinimicrobiota bacterium]|jgi:uncharacterized membrane protein|nr:YciC family protein [Candidatus Neomarinimicrobiota bacterium]MDD3966632.1 YciC family protein [Candidatus Neomarinimicrobiota bacterium]MDX9780079.1 YciC family protein [bacterium]
MFTLLPAFRYGWQQMQKNIWTFALLALLLSLADIGGNIKLKAAGIDEILMLERPWEYLSVDIVLWMGAFLVFAACLNFFVVTLVLAILHGEAILPYLKRKIRLFPAYLGLMLLKYLLTGIGLLFFIVPGLLLMLAFYFAEYLLIDKEITLIKSLRQSAEITRGSRLGIFLFEVDVFIISYILAFPQNIWPDTVLTYVILALINLVWLPVAWNAAGHIYRFVSEMQLPRSG